MVYTPGQERCFVKRDFCEEAHGSAGVAVVTRTVSTASAVKRAP
jgi:hypothetical protein